jgi:hypothetical protein
MRRAKQFMHEHVRRRRGSTHSGRRPSGRQFVRMLITVLAIFASGGSARADTAPGVEVTNWAVGLSDGGVTVSTPVSVTVSRVVGVQISPSSGARTVDPGETVLVPLAVTNTGNGPDAFDLVAACTGGWDSVAYSDDNGDGTHQATETTVVTNTGTLDAGWGYYCFLSVTTPSGVAGTETATLTATSTAGGAASASARFVIGTGCWPPGFLDVPPDHWAHDEIQACYCPGVVQGYPDGFYRPHREVTRDQMAVYICRAMVGGDGNVPPGPPEASFPDVPVDGEGTDGTEPHWAYHHVEYVAANNVVQGYNDGNYHPVRTVTRAQMAVFIARSIAVPPGDEGLSTYEPPAVPSFSDVPLGFWSYPHIEYLAGSGVVGGYPDGRYRPTGSVTRDQMAVYMARAFALPMY